MTYLRWTLSRNFPPVIISSTFCHVISRGQIDWATLFRFLRADDQARDQVVLEFAKMMVSTFRGGDLVCRIGDGEFAVAMPDASESQAEFPIQRLTRETELWNLNTKFNYELSFNWAVTSYASGETPQDLLRRVERGISAKNPAAESRVQHLAELCYRGKELEPCHDDRRASTSGKQRSVPN